jgi:putative spermidine/putrescine transport system ATP-binding protein
MKGQELVLSNITKVYGDVRALDAIDLTLPPGSLTTLLGPSGCGKTSLLRIVAGLTSLSGGQVRLGSRDISDVPANHRNIGVVFQNYALFPHMTVAENVGFGLRARGIPRAQIGERVRNVLDLVHLGKLAGRYPSQLSGGQQQRTALARALVIEPDLLLLDEPLSALDKNLRHSVQQELRKLQKDIGITTLVVTHDQDEAFVLSDEIVVMNGGKVLQRGRPDDIYDRPKTRFVAEFLGDGNFVKAGVEGIPPDCLIEGEGGRGPLPAHQCRSFAANDTLFFRPERIELRSEPDCARDGINLMVRVRDMISLGGVCEVLLQTEQGTPLIAHFNRRESGGLAIGQRVVAFVGSKDLTCLDDA